MHVTRVTGSKFVVSKYLFPRKKSEHKKY